MDYVFQKTLQELREAWDRVDVMDIPFDEIHLTEETQRAIKYYQERVADLSHQLARLAALEEGLFLWNNRGANQHKPPVTLDPDAIEWNSQQVATSTITRQQEIDSLLQNSGNLLGPNPPPAQAASAPPAGPRQADTG